MMFTGGMREFAKSQSQKLTQIALKLPKDKLAVSDCHSVLRVQLSTNATKYFCRRFHVTENLQFVLMMCV